MKYLTLILSAIAHIATAQCTLSDPFSIPERAAKPKVVQCSNGNTFLFNFTMTKGIDIMVFNPDHQLIGTAGIKGVKWDYKNMSQCDIPGIFELNGQMAIFLQQTCGKTSKLFRITLDLQNGTFLKEETIAEMPAGKRDDEPGMFLKKSPHKQFTVEKDAASGYYIILPGDGIDAVSTAPVPFYTTENKLPDPYIYRSDSSASERYLSTCSGEGRFFIASCLNASGNDSIYISKITSDQWKAERYCVKNAWNGTLLKARLTYNPATNNIALLTIVHPENEKTTYGDRAMFQLLDASSFSVRKTIILDDSTIAKYIGTAHPGSFFWNDLRSFNIKDDNTVHIVLEQYKPYPDSRRPYFSYTDIGLLSIDSSGQLRGFAFRKNQSDSKPLPPYSSDLPGPCRLYRPVANFFTDWASISIINTTPYQYLIWNDKDKNITSTGQDKPKMVTAADFSRSNTVCYKIGADRVSKSFLFGTPDSSFDNRYAYINAGNYLPATQTYATLIIERKDKHSVARMAWIKFD